MASERTRDIIRILDQKAGWMTAAQLASEVGCSARTVKSDIYALNRSHEGLIVASTKGYQLSDRVCAAEILAVQKNDIPQTAEARKRYILFELLMRHREVRASDLAENLYISLATLDNELVAIKRSLTQYGLSLHSRNGVLYVEGSASGEKKMVNQLIFDETKDFFSQLELINHYFPRFDLKELELRIDAALKNRGFFINGYALSNLLIHVAIFMERAQNGFDSIPTQVKPILLDNLKDEVTDTAEEVCVIIEEVLGAPVSEVNRESVRLMLAANLIQSRGIEPADPEHRRALELLAYVADRVSDQFGLDFNDDEFRLRFSLHLANLLSRSRYGMLLRNPQLEAIKNGQPFIYDVAVFVADVIRGKTGIDVTEDEIGYIALHVGCLVEEQRANAHKLHALLVCTRHNVYDAARIDSFSRELDSMLIIDAVVSTIAQAGEVSRFDIVISNVPLASFVSVPVVTISPFFSADDIRLVSERVGAMLRDKVRDDLEQSMRLFFKEEFFTRELCASTSHTVIQAMSSELVKRGYAFEDFTERLLEREAMSSSAYADIAMPHPVDMDAKKTAVSVALFPKGLDWQGTTVYAVIMLAIKRDDRAFFGELFNYIARVLLNAGAVRTIAQAQTYQEFLDALLRYV